MQEVAPSTLFPCLCAPGYSHLQSWEVSDVVAGLVPFQSMHHLVPRPCLIKPSTPLPNAHGASLHHSKTKGGRHRCITPALPYPALPFIQSVTTWGEGGKLTFSEGQGRGRGRSSAGHEGRQETGSLGSGRAPPTQSLMVCISPPTMSPLSGRGSGCTE